IASLSGCSVLFGGRDPCTSTTECRQLFGFNFTCNQDALCEPFHLIAGCTETFPVDLLVRPDQYGSAIAIGTLFDRSSPTEAAHERAVRLAVEEVSTMEGFEGRSLALVQCTTQADAGIDKTDAVLRPASFLAGTVDVSAIVGPSDFLDLRH